MDANEWGRLMGAVDEINSFFEEDIAFIGGVAVYAHAMARADSEAFAAFSHDADFVISLSAFADLRDIEYTTPNARLGKQQFVKAGFEFDVYVQYQNNLRIPTEEIIAGAEKRSGLMVASLEHLLILKTEAYKDRKGTSKGVKDAQDIVRILYLMETPDQDMLERLTGADLDLVKGAVSQDIVISVLDGNRHYAKPVKTKVDEIVVSLAEMVKQNESDSPEP